MNYEQKYKKVLEQAKQAIENIPDKSLISWLENIFPELHESKDKDIKQFLVDFIKVCGWTEKKDQGWPSKEKCISWLEKQGEKSWSEEDKEMIDFMIEFIESLYWRDLTKRKDEVLSWLNSLKDRVQLQPKQEWSEEDDIRLDHLIGLIQKYGLDYYKSIDKVIDSIHWLKSLNPNHWKPSEEQMEALNAINNVGELSYVGQGDLLVKLYQDLKKL